MTEMLILKLLMRKKPTYFLIFPLRLLGREPPAPPQQINEGLYKHEKRDYNNELVFIILCLSFSFPFSFLSFPFPFSPSYFWWGQAR